MCCTFDHSLVVVLLGLHERSLCGFEDERSCFKNVESKRRKQWTMWEITFPSKKELRNLNCTQFGLKFVWNCKSALKKIEKMRRKRERKVFRCALFHFRQKYSALSALTFGITAWTILWKLRKFTQILIGSKIMYWFCYKKKERKHKKWSLSWEQRSVLWEMCWNRGVRFSVKCVCKK